MVTFWPVGVVSVKPDADTLVTVPDDPPAAGPDRALDPAPPAWAADGCPCCADVTLGVLAAVAVLDPPEAADTIPNAPPPIARAATPYPSPVRTSRNENKWNNG